MIVNENKSEIIEFHPRQKRASSEFRITNSPKTFHDIPIVSEYKYLGMTRTLALKRSKLIENGKNRASEVYTNILLKLIQRKTYGKNLCCFLLNLYILPLYVNEDTNTYRQRIEHVILRTFKLFLGLSRNTSNKLTSNLLGYDFSKRAYFIQTLSQIQWEERKKEKSPITKHKIFLFKRQTNQHLGQNPPKNSSQMQMYKQHRSSSVLPLISRAQN